MSRWGGERGSALVLAISVLSVLTLLTTMCLMTAGADLLLSGRMYKERQSFFQAQSALVAAVYDLEHATPPLIPPEVFFAPWTPITLPRQSLSEGAWAITRRIASLPDTRNADGDAATEVVLYNRRFGYAGSPLAEGGYPVFQLMITAAGGENRQAVVAEVAPVTCAPVIDAAWTAGGALQLEGRVAVSGLGHTRDGEPDAGTAAVAGVISPGTIHIGSGVVVEGRRDGTAAGAISEPERAVPEDGLQALNAGESLSRLEDLASPPEGGSLGGIVWSRGTYSGPLDGEGILLVHNPDFRPRAYESSRLAVEEGRYTADYDPAYSHLDLAHQPAMLEVIRGGTYRGVIIADAVGACDQELNLIGGLITLSRSPQRVGALALFRVRFSNDAAHRAGRGPLRHWTAFRPLPATVERLP